MIKPKCFTTIEIKQEHIDKFCDFIKDQLAYGGKKYASSDKREATDFITEICGVEWTIGTMLKYLLRFKNLQREKDIFKVATYAYILWLQMGFHLHKEHETDTRKEHTSR